MKKTTLMLRIKDFIGGIAWKVFIWSSDMTEEEYWNAIYKQELNRTNPPAID